ncbi:MAG: hypothetical protein ACYS8L_03205 [Planctomycetota bacterium]|jgi:CHASE3 domain sensor protein
MRSTLIAVVACLLLVLASGCAYVGWEPMDRSYNSLQAKMGAPTEIEYSRWNILGLVGGAKISVESEAENDD